MKVQGTYRLYPSGTAVSGATVELFDADDLVTDLASTTTAADGTWTISEDFNPGKWWIKITDSVNTVVRWISSTDTVMQGPNSSYDINYVLASLGDGVCKNVLNELEVTASGLTSTVDTGAASVKGIVASALSTTDLIHDAHDANPRYDRIVLEVTRLGQTDEGKSLVKIVKGTAAASPSLPSLTQSSSVWQYELCEALVPATSGALTLTDRRTYIGQDPLSRPVPLLTNFSSTTTVASGSFNSGAVLTSIYAFSQTNNNHISDGIFEAYVQITLTSGLVTLAAYADAVTAIVGQTVVCSTAGTYIVPLRVSYAAKGPAAARTLGVAAYKSAGGSVSATGCSAFNTQYPRVTP